MGITDKPGSVRVGRYRRRSASCSQVACPVVLEPSVSCVCGTLCQACRVCGSAWRVSVFWRKSLRPDSRPSRKSFTLLYFAIAPWGVCRVAWRSCFSDSYFAESRESPLSENPLSLLTRTHGLFSTVHTHIYPYYTTIIYSTCVTNTTPHFYTLS